MTEAMDDTDKNLPVIEDAKEDGMLPNVFLDPEVQTQVLDKQGADPGEHNANPQDHQAEGGNGNQPAEANPTCIVKDMYPGAAAVVASAHSTFYTLYDEQMETGNGNIHYQFAGHME